MDERAKLGAEVVLDILRGSLVAATLVIKDEQCLPVRAGKLRSERSPDRSHARILLRVSRNRGFSSWSTTPGPTNRFSGASKAKVGLLVRLVGSQNVTPVLAPPEHTKEWFNALYAKLIGKSFRPKEGEYLIAAPSVEAEVVRVKTWGRR